MSIQIWAQLGGPKPYLVGGLEHVLVFPTKWLILFSGVETTNQHMFWWGTVEQPKPGDLGVPSFAERYCSCKAQAVVLDHHSQRDLSYRVFLTTRVVDNNHRNSIRPTFSHHTRGVPYWHNHAWVDRVTPWWFLAELCGGEKSERQEEREEDERKKEATGSLLFFHCQISSQFVVKKLLQRLSWSKVLKPISPINQASSPLLFHDQSWWEDLIWEQH